MFCLSKGLAAPVGSLLVGDADVISEARRVRKMFGGGMRQVGVIAAAGLVALEEMAPRVDQDNATARHLAERLAEIPGIDLDPATVETNIVFFGLDEDAGLTAPELATRLAEVGVRVHALGPDSVRMVTHYHISREDVEWAAERVRDALGVGVGA